MIALVHSLGMMRTGAAHHQHDGVELMTAVLAEIGAFLSALIQFVVAAVAAVGVTGAGG